VKAMFAHLTTADFRAAERKRVHALFDVIQVAIHARDRATVDDAQGVAVNQLTDQRGGRRKGFRAAHRGLFWGTGRQGRHREGASSAQAFGQGKRAGS
jgi:hypothetical protein